MAELSIKKGGTVLKKLTFVGVLSLASSSASAAPVSTLYNDYPFQCGALYVIIGQGYEESNDQQKAAFYQKKFQTLYVQGKKSFEERGRSDEEAEAYMRKHVDMLGKLYLHDRRLILKTMQLCSRIFP